LQACVSDARTKPFRELMRTSTREFYDDSAGVHYAQARYLCYYLQQKGKLVDFYHRFRQNAESDPSGVTTLETILEIDDWAAFQQEWEEFVQKLRF
jgi:hypothetical protein